MNSSCTNFVHCNNCFRRDAGIKYFLTSCGHLFCVACIGDKICKVCKTSVNIVPLDSSMSEDMKDLFGDANRILKKFQKIEAFQRMHRELLVKGLTIENKKHKAELLRARKDIEHLREQMRGHNCPTMDSKQTTGGGVPKFNFAFRNNAQSPGRSSQYVQSTNPESQKPFKTGAVSTPSGSIYATPSAQMVEMKPPWPESGYTGHPRQANSQQYLKSLDTQRKSSSMQPGPSSSGNRRMSASQKPRYSQPNGTGSSQIKYRMETSANGSTLSYNQNSHFRAGIDRLCLPVKKSPVEVGEKHLKPVRSYLSPVVPNSDFASSPCSYFSAATSIRTPLVANRKRVSVSPYTP